MRYSFLPETASIFPHTLLDSALLKMRAAASDALVQRTLHPPRIPRKPAAAGQSGGSSTARSGQAGTSGASAGAEAVSYFFSLEAPAAQEVRVREPGRSLPDGAPLPVKVGGMPVSALEAVAGNWSRDLGGDRPSGRLPRPVHGLLLP